MKHWFKKWEPLWQPLAELNLSVYAASACYYVVLSLVPTSLLLFSLISALPNTGAYDAIIRMLIPDYLAEIIKPLEQIRNQKPIGFISVSGIIAIWSASKIVLTVRSGLNAAMNYSAREHYLRKRLRAMLLLLLLFLLFLIILSLALLGQGFLSRLYDRGTVLPRWLKTTIQFRFIFLLLIANIGLTVVYAILPKNKLSTKYCILSGLLSSTICLIFSFMFSFYVNYLSDYENLYGVLGITILGMIWIRVCTGVILYVGRFSYLSQQKLYNPRRIIQSIISAKRKDY